MSNLRQRSWVEIDLNTIRENYKIYRALLSPGQEIMAVVKADAYGHGDKEVSRALQAAGCRRFAVSNIDEALRLRQAGVAGEILILGYTPPGRFDDLVRENITQAVLSEDYAASLSAHGGIVCQFAVDTGMNRIGLDADDPDRCADFIRAFARREKVTGMFTHLCTADTADRESQAFTEGQIAKFRAVAERLEDLALPEIHCLNSAGGLWHNDGSGLIRLGIILYGLKPDRTNLLPPEIRPALSWKTVVSMVKTVRLGETVGYGRSWGPEAERVIATLSTGYADGYARLLSNRGRVLLRGVSAPIVGRVCMDQMMADVTGILGVEPGDVATLLGSDGAASYTADDMAADIGTIGYEVLCSISKRVERVYIEGSERQSP